MKKLFLLLTVLATITACQKNKDENPINHLTWQTKSIDLSKTDSLIKGSSYLPVYPVIYSLTEERTHNLTVTVSIRNMSSTDSVFILNSDYYNTNGDLIRSYLKNPVFIKPMETIEIVIDEKDEDGGTGANFIFDWAIKHTGTAPFFEAVMISTSGQQGLSFTTQGVRR